MAAWPGSHQPEQELKQSGGGHAGDPRIRAAAERSVQVGGEGAGGKPIGLHKISLENWVPGTRDDCSSRLSAFSFRKEQSHE